MLGGYHTTYQHSTQQSIAAPDFVLRETTKRRRLVVYYERFCKSDEVDRGLVTE
jgi:hypothetical protein